MNRNSRTFTLLPLAFTLITQLGSAQNPSVATTASGVAVGPQYDSTHVYVSPSDADAFVESFIGTFGGKSTKQVVVTVTPTPSSTKSQLVQTPYGTISLFGFLTPIPYPFGTERTGYLVKDIDAAIIKARSSGAEVVVAPFPDPIGRDAIIRFPGDVTTQIYWHTTAPSYTPFEKIPENRVYVSPDSADKFLRSFLAFSGGRVVSDQPTASGNEIGLQNDTIRRVQVDSDFGKLLVFVTDRSLPFPFGHEITGYEVVDLDSTLQKAKSLGVKVLITPITTQDRLSAMVQFPGGYVAEIHSTAVSEKH